MHATRHNPTTTTTTTTTTTREMTDSEEKKEPTTTEREEEPTTKDAPESPKVGEKRHRDPGEDEESKDETREVRGKIDGNDETTEKEEPGEEKKETTDKTTETAAATTTTTTTTTGGFGSALSGAGFGGFGGLKSAAASGGGFGGFAAAKASSGGGFASAPKVPVFSASSAPVALFGASKKKGSDDEEEGDDDPEREVANDSIKPVVELELVETKTGEEDETCAFRTEGALFEYVTDAEKGARWVDRGRGDLHLNEGENGSRIVMRAKGNYRLMLNAALFKGQKFQLMEGGKGVSFSCKNVAAGADAKMSTFALKMRAAASNAQSQAEGFHNAATKAIAKLSEEA
jgi:Ran-binding protein 3